MTQEEDKKKGIFNTALNEVATNEVVDRDQLEKLRDATSALIDSKGNSAEKEKMIKGLIKDPIGYARTIGFNTSAKIISKPVMTRKILAGYALVEFYKKKIKDYSVELKTGYSEELKSKISIPRLKFIQKSLGKIKKLKTMNQLISHYNKNHPFSEYEHRLTIGDISNYSEESVELIQDVQAHSTFDNENKPVDDMFKKWQKELDVHIATAQKKIEAKEKANSIKKQTTLSDRLQQKAEKLTFKEHDTSNLDSTLDAAGLLGSGKDAVKGAIMDFNQLAHLHKDMNEALDGAFSHFQKKENLNSMKAVNTLRQHVNNRMSAKKNNTAYKKIATLSPDSGNTDDNQQIAKINQAIEAFEAKQREIEKKYTDNPQLQGTQNQQNFNKRLTESLTKLDVTAGKNPEKKEEIGAMMQCLAHNCDLLKTPQNDGGLHNFMKTTGKVMQGPKYAPKAPTPEKQRRPNFCNIKMLDEKKLGKRHVGSKTKKVNFDTAGINAANMENILDQLQKQQPKAVITRTYDKNGNMTYSFKGPQGTASAFMSLVQQAKKGLKQEGKLGTENENTNTETLTATGKKAKRTSILSAERISKRISSGDNPSFVHDRNRAKRKASHSLNTATLQSSTANVGNSPTPQRGTP